MVGIVAQRARDREGLPADASACCNGRLAPDGMAAWAQVVERGYEGYVAKDEGSPYEGGPMRRWLKVKQPGWTDEEDRWRRRIFGEDRR